LNFFPFDTRFQIFFSHSHTHTEATNRPIEIQVSQENRSKNELYVDLLERITVLVDKVIILSTISRQPSLSFSLSLSLSPSFSPSLPLSLSTCVYEQDRMSSVSF
jgi:hypothetical protein